MLRGWGVGSCGDMVADFRKSDASSWERGAGSATTGVHVVRWPVQACLKFVMVATIWPLDMAVREIRLNVIALVR